MDVVSYKGKTLIVSGIQDIVDTLIFDSETSELGELLRNYHKKLLDHISGYDSEIEALEQENSDLEDEITDLENEISDLESNIEKLEAA